MPTNTTDENTNCIPSKKSTSDLVFSKLLLIETRISDIKGQGMTEYALILGVIAMVCFFAIRSLGTSVFDAFFNKAASTFANATK